MIQIIPLTTLPKAWSTDNVTLKIKLQNTYLFIPGSFPQARYSSFIPGRLSHKLDKQPSQQKIKSK